MPQTNTTIAPQQTSPPAKQTSGSQGIALQIIGQGGGVLLRELDILPGLSSVFASFTFAFLVIYWIGPRPAHSFRHHALNVAFWMTVFHAGLLGLPQMLSGLVSGSIAHGLSFFFIALGVYWWWPFSITPHTKRNFWLWATGSLILAAFYGWVRGLFL